MNKSNKISMAEYKALNYQQTSYNKYGNKPVKWTGKWRGEEVTISFASGQEMRDGIDLIRREAAGQISNLEFHKKFLLIPKSETEKAWTYINDAYYFDKSFSCWVSQDSKGHATAEYIGKRKLFKQKNPGILFLEIRMA